MRRSYLIKIGPDEMRKKRFTRPIEERFWNKVEKTNGCWNWTGALNGGYGTIGIGRSGEGNILAHRLSWMLHNEMKDIPSEIFVCHTCDNRRCVRIEHLFLGSRQDNQRDMTDKGRSLRGERHNLVCLTESEVLEIRRIWNEDKSMKQKDIAAKFNTTKGNISQIVRGKRWKHILPDGWATPLRSKWG